MDWADEEGARFGRSLLGSSAFAGTATIAADRVRTDRDGIRLEDALRRCGVEIDRFAEAHARAEKRRRLHRTAHRAGAGARAPGLAAGGGAGHQRRRAPRHHLSRAGGALRLDADERRGATRWPPPPNSRWKFAPSPGSMPTRCAPWAASRRSPGSSPPWWAAARPRSTSATSMPAVLAQMFREAREASERFAREERCTVEWSRIWNIEPDRRSIPKMVDFCEEAIREIAGETKAHRLPSGPLHDAAEVSRAGIPTVMMFVQSLRRHQPQQNRRHPRRAPRTGRARLRPARLESHPAPHVKGRRRPAEVSSGLPGRLGVLFCNRRRFLIVSSEHVRHRLFSIR